LAERGPFIVRHRRAVTIGATVALGLLFMLHLFRWHFPYRLSGATGEWPLLAAASAMGVAARFGLPVLSARFGGSASLPVAAIASVVAYLALQAADPFVARRDWRYAPPGCDFALSFPRRPDIITGESGAAAAGSLRIERAVHVEVGTGLALSAECAPLERPLSVAEIPGYGDRAEALLRQSADRLRLKIGSVARLGADTVALSGVADEGRTADNEPLLRKGEARAVVGARSLLVAWAWRISRDPAVGTGAEAASFFASIRPAAMP